MNELIYQEVGLPYIDIDRVIRTLTPGEIQSQIRLAEYALQGNLTKGEEIYWLTFKADYELALEIAEWWEQQPIKPEIPAGKASPIEHYIKYLDKRLRKAEIILKGISSYLKSEAERKDKGEYY